MNSLTSLIDRHSLPVIAVVGRPNVGKSTLFNRMIRKRRSITDPTPGVTRDPVEAVWEIDDRQIIVVDTGGYKIETREMDRKVNEKSLAVLEKADLILFMMDVTEVTAEDQSFAEILRKFGKKVILVANKADNDKREQDIWNFHSFGFQEVIGISAEHGINFDVLCDLVLKNIDFSKYDGVYEEKNDEINIAVLGKPNTGKSTLTNTMLGGEYSIVSDIPGTTRDVLEGLFEFEDMKFRVFDTAGIRRKKKVGENIEYYSVNRAIASIENADVVFLMIDAIEGLAEQDKKIAQQIVNKGKGLIIVLNKWDLMEKKGNTLNAVTDRIRFVFPVLSFAPLLPVSAKNNDGISALLKKALEVYKQLQIRIDTGILNRAMRQWIEESPPPSGKKHFKLRYITQVSKHPVVFVVFVNKTKGFPEFYRGYVKNRIRKEFGFTEIPVEVDIREG